MLEPMKSAEPSPPITNALSLISMCAYAGRAGNRLWLPLGDTNAKPTVPYAVGVHAHDDVSADEITSKEWQDGWVTDGWRNGVKE